MLLLFLTQLTTSCQPEKSKFSDKEVFRFNQFENVSSLDPAFARDIPNIWATNQLFNGLVQLDDSLRIKPDIALSWLISNDNLEYTFKLREDVWFHKNAVFPFPDSTRRVTARDFTYSFNRLTNPKLASPGAWVLKNVESYRALDNFTFQIRLKKAFPAFLGLLSMRYCSVVPREAVEYYGIQFRANPVGTGPFFFKLWEENIKLVLRKNNNYFEKDDSGKKLPYLEAVAITFLPDKQSEFLLFMQGKLDLLNSLDSSYKDELLTPTGKLRPSYKDKVKMDKGPYLNTIYLGFYLDGKKSEVHSKLLRKAINYGFDRNKMITFLNNGIGTPATSGFIPKGVPGYVEDSGFTYDPVKAKSYIEQYIQSTGDTQPKVRIATDNNYQTLCEFIQRELEKLGIQVAVDVMPSSTIRKKKWSGELDIFRASWIADYPDAENFLSPFYSPNFTPNGPNYTHFKNEAFDRLYEMSFMVQKDSLRQLMYTQMDSIITAHAPIIPLYYDEVIRFTQRNVKGLTTNPQNFLVLKRVWKEDK